MAKGLYSNEELIDTLISDLNSVIQQAISGQYLQCSVIISGMAQKLINLKDGVKKEIALKNETIEDLKGMLKSNGVETVDIPAEEL